MTGPAVAWIAILLAIAMSAAGAPKPPAYHADRRFDVAFTDKSALINNTKFLEALEALEGVQVVLPGPAVRYPLHLPPDKRRLRDGMDDIADLMQGEWKKVEGAYVLVMDPVMMDIADMMPDDREKAAREALAKLVASLSPQQVAWLSKGGVISSLTAPAAQKPLMLQLGRLGYWQYPRQVSPNATRGQNVSLQLAGEDRQLRISLPARSGRPRLWLAVPLTPEP